MLENDQNEDISISAPVKAKQTISVRFNNELKMFEGLPKAWRELLEMTP